MPQLTIVYVIQSALFTLYTKHDRIRLDGRTKYIVCLCADGNCHSTIQAAFTHKKTRCCHGLNGKHAAKTIGNYCRLTMHQWKSHINSTR